MEILFNILYYVIPFIVLLGILVFVHEFGHFLIARLLGVTVTDFSLGFGKELWSRQDKHGTKWKISAIPLGGYCQFLGDADASSTTNADLSALSEEQKKGAFQAQKPWKKLAIAVAGPLFNYLFAIVVFIALFYSVGRMVIPSIVGGTIAGEAAEQAGIMAGDRIVAINGHETPDFQAITNEVMLAETDDVVVNVERPMTLKLTAEEMSFDLGDRQINNEKVIGLLSMPKNDGEKSQNLPPVVHYVIENSPAAKAGFARGDILQTINGVALNSFTDLKKYVNTHENEEFEIAFLRPIAFAVTLRDSEYDPGDGKVKRRLLGITSSQEVSFAEKNMSLSAATKAGLKETYDVTVSTLRAIGQMISGKRGGKEVGGIIRIAEMSGDVSKKGGLLSFVYFMALLSVNLGMLNLLPIPVLDGGNVVIFVIEMIIGRELNVKIKDYIFKFGLLIILAIMVLATWNDIVHLIGRFFDK